MLTYGQVLDGLKEGKSYSRDGWDAPEAIFLVSGSTFSVNREPLLSILGEGTQVQYRSHIDKVNADGSIGMWSPSNEDQLADDWVEV